MLEDNWSMEFMQANGVSLKIAAEIEKALKFNGLPSLIPIINCLSISLKLPDQIKQANSTLCISPKGFGKSTLLIYILAKSNPKFFTILDKNIFESQLLEKPREYFEGKVLIHDDLISAFGGKNRKQREQLTSFFSQLLSDGTYSREGKKLENVCCIAQFGIARESFEKHRKDLLDGTFLDRFLTYSVELDNLQKLEVLQHRDHMMDYNVQLPIIKLPFSKRKQEIKLVLTEEQKNKVNKLAIQLESYRVMSSTRTQNFIKIFMLCNALLNNRKETCQYDLELYEVLHQFHLNSASQMSKKQQIIALKQQFPDKNNEELIDISGIPKTTFYRNL